MQDRARTLGGFALLVAVGLAQPAAAVSFDWVEVGAPGNAADTTGFGSVAVDYLIARHEVTNAQYTDFLNAKAASDPLGLYNPLMSGSTGGILQAGSSGSFTYSTVAGRETNPVVYVSFFDALRFTNWLHNGQGSGDTETGAYTLLGGSPTPSNATTVTRNSGASAFLTSEDEWYKAAYYDAVSSSYTPDPFASGASGTCQAPPGATSQSANCFFAVGNTTDVGSYPGSPSSSGTLDQAGNVDEWVETIVGSNRGLRGASWRDNPADFSATFTSSAFSSVESDFVGFRVASLPVPVPEPGTAALLAWGFLGLGLARHGRTKRG